MVAGVEIRGEQEEIWVHLDVRSDAVHRCPECGAPCPNYDRSEERTWRHLDTCQYQTIIAARIPRIQCVEHGIRRIQVPWAEKRSRFTALFEALAIRLLRETTVLGLTRLMNVSWHEAEGIQRRAVKRGLDRRGDEPIRALGIDEKSFQKRHEYVTVAVDLDGECVWWVGDHRRKETLDRFYTDELAQRVDEIEEVVMDMWPPYIRSTRTHVPEGKEKIVFDKFHVVRHLVDAVDRVRRKEHNELRTRGDTRLAGTKYWWLKGPATRSDDDARQIRRLTRAGLKVGRAWAIKEAALKLWTYQSETWARRYFKRWYFWATHSRLEPVIHVAKMMKQHLDGILAYLRNRRTNAITEGLNSIIQEIKYHARGYRNRDSFRMAILFHCGRLNMDPL
jgi:transposase